MPAPVCDPGQLVEAIATFVAHKGGVDPALVRGRVERAIQDLGEDSVGELQLRSRRKAMPGRITRAILSRSACITF
jgi:hypothetical protein